MWMLVEEFLGDAPDRGEAAVPQLHAPVRREHGQRFEQRIERGRARAQQRVAGGRQGELLGSVLRHQHQSAIGQRLGDDAQMGAVRQGPCILDRRVAGEPLRQFRTPGGKVPRFGQAPRIAGLIQKPIEVWRIDARGPGQRENPLKRLVGKRQPAIGIELGNADGKLVQHAALRCAEGAKGAGLLFHFLDINGVSGNAFLAQRKIADAQGAPLIAHGGLHDALHRHVPAVRLLGHLCRA